MLSVVDKIVITAYRIEKSGKRPFSAEDLVVFAWRYFPDAFGLSGYYEEKGTPLYPNSNRVFAEIMGSKPIRKRGYLIKVGEKMYQLTESGQAEAKRLSGFSDTSSKKATLARDYISEIERLLETRAFLKASTNDIENITFFDACSLWNISPRSSAIVFEGKVTNMLSTIKTAIDNFQGEDVSFTHGGEIIRIKDLKFLLELHEKLLIKCDEELKIIRSRKDER